MLAAIVEQSSQIAELCRRYGVRKLEVFGSAAVGGFDAESSDVDLIADFADRSPGYARRYLAFAEELEKLFDRPVDLLTNQPIENPYFRASLERSRRTIYESPDREAAA
ncbi:MAG: nucleotidyltransferase domain-containing protein [Thermomicrobiales bacterium]|nr:nucleotidyltransferase domain-containing protein [Thermomicrobiales bacterium]